MELDDERPIGEEPLVPVVLGDEERILILFAYMGPLALISLLAGRREFVRWHAKQGLLLAAATLITFVALRPPHLLFYYIWPFLGEIFLTMEILIGFGFLMTAVLCMVRGLEGLRFRIPFLGDLADRF